VNNKTIVGLPKRFIYSKLLAIGVYCASLILSQRAAAFALLGPYEPWMQYTNGLRRPGDIGGPMNIGNGYRWNVPIVTYGFDHSFLDFFGSNGVAAVESAIQILDDLPPASQIGLTNYPLFIRRQNITAVSENLYDLKSETLALLIEQMGLAQPSRYDFVLKQWSLAFLDYVVPYYWYFVTSDAFYWSWAYPDYIVSRNFDPVTYSPSFFVDGVLYGSSMDIYNGEDYLGPYAAYFAEEYLPAVADENSLLTPQPPNPGQYLRGLTQDDVGGLRYLYSTNNIAYEKLLPDVRRSHDCREKLTDGAWRPGIDKLTFVPQPTERKTGRFLPIV
jgi:hypothetical protein